MHTDIHHFNQNLPENEREICHRLAVCIDQNLPQAESKIWHRHPVWFLDGNPTVGYSLQKAGVRLMFWSGADFGEEQLAHRGGKFKDASRFYTSPEEVDTDDLKRWLKKSEEIQWDYKNLIKRRGTLARLK